MSLSKDYYAKFGFSEPLTREVPIYEVGQRFTIDFGINKSQKGTWEIVRSERSPFYDCIRVLKNGTLSKSTLLSNKRSIYVSTIKQAMK